MIDNDFDSRHLVPIEQIDKIMNKHESLFTNRERLFYANTAIVCTDTPKVVHKKQKVITRLIQSKLN